MENKVGFQPRIYLWQRYTESCKCSHVACWFSSSFIGVEGPEQSTSQLHVQGHPFSTAWVLAHKHRQFPFICIWVHPTWRSHDRLKPRFKRNSGNTGPARDLWACLPAVGPSCSWLELKKKRKKKRLSDSWRPAALSVRRERGTFLS